MTFPNLLQLQMAGNYWNGYRFSVSIAIMSFECKLNLDTQLEWNNI